MDILSLETFVESTLIALGQYGFILVIIFALIHPIFEGPFALFNLGLGIYIMGAIPAYIIIFTANVIGCVFLYLLVKKVDRFSNYYLHKKKVSGNVITWLKETKKWKHIFVLGVPVIPTYPVKIGYLLSEPSFKETMKTLVGMYIFLFFANTLIFYGILNFLETGLARILSVVLLVILVLFVYFGKSIFSKIGLVKGES